MGLAGKGKSFLPLKFKVGNQVIEFPKNLFDLDTNNFSILSDQIAKIPGEIAQVGLAHSEAEKDYRKIKDEFEIWKSERISLFEEGTRSSEAYKENKVRENYKKEYSEYMSRLREANYIAGILKSYKSSIEAKYQLSQTLSANLRREMATYETA